VIAVEPEAMCPAVVQGDTVIGGDNGRWNRLTRHCGRFVGSGSGGSVGTVKTTLTGHELVEAFLVFGSEICNKFTNSFVGSWAHMP